ncbi:hypothetical protein VN97_g2569 [Penicillium thymicola]|uniref:Uncharacterized protein n=1 Tax=Penicillium thymicola TaxID=293382 RepID=A0AAI9TPZ6_PENTH|nr:hypothetical protein VN97_g2569 [Penicillium thymicola]
MCTVAEPRPIPVPNDEQLEKLTQLRVRASQRAERREWIYHAISRAINRVDTAMVAVENYYQILVAENGRLMRIRRHLLGKLSAEQHNDERLECELWDEIC